MVFGSGADHGGATDINLFDRLRQRHPFPGDRLLKGIKIHNHQIDRGDLIGSQISAIALQIGAGQNSPMHTRVECLDPAAQNFREACIVRNLGHGESCGFDGISRATAADQGKAEPFHQLASQFD